MDLKKKQAHDLIVRGLKKLKGSKKIESWETKLTPFRKGREKTALMYSVYPMKEWLDGHFIILNVLFVEQDVPVHVTKQSQQKFHTDLVIGKNFCCVDIDGCLQKFFVSQVEKLLREKKIVEEYNKFAEKNDIPYTLHTAKTSQDIEFAIDVYIVHEVRNAKGRKKSVKVPLQLKTDEKSFDLHKKHHANIPSLLFDHKNPNFRLIWRALALIFDYHRKHNVSEHFNVKSLSSSLKKLLDGVRLEKAA